MDTSRATRVKMKFAPLLVAWIGGTLLGNSLDEPWDRLVVVLVGFGVPAVLIVVLGPRIEMKRWSALLLGVPIFGYLLGGRALWRVCWLPASDWEGGWAPLPGRLWRLLAVLGGAVIAYAAWSMVPEFGIGADDAEVVAVAAVGRRGEVVQRIEVDGSHVFAVRTRSRDEYRAVVLTPDERPFGTLWDADRPPQTFGPGCNGYVGSESVCLWVTSPKVARVEVSFTDARPLIVHPVGGVALFTRGANTSPPGVLSVRLLDDEGRDVDAELLPMPAFVLPQSPSDGAEPRVVEPVAP